MLTPDLYMLSVDKIFYYERVVTRLTKIVTQEMLCKRSIVHEYTEFWKRLGYQSRQLPDFQSSIADNLEGEKH